MLTEETPQDQHPHDSDNDPVTRVDRQWFRVLVTGSRTWTDARAIEDALLKATREIYRTAEITIVHGACPTGADEIAARLATFHGFWSEAYPADWGLFGKAAGPQRNQKMVDLGANVCLAFPLGASRGTRDCMRRAEAAGIPVINYGDPS